MKVTLIAAQTIDGFIGRDDYHTSTDWTSKEDATWFRQKTKEIGVMIMGRKTFETIGRPLPGRTIVVMTRNISDQFDGLDSEEVLVQKQPGLLYTSASPKEVIQALEEQGRTDVAICGGSSIYAQFMEAGLVTELLLTVEPVIFGSGVPLFSKELQLEKQPRLQAVEHLSEQTVLLKYAFKTE